MVGVFLLGLIVGLLLALPIGAICHKHGDDGACKRWQNIYNADQEWWRNHLSKERDALDTRRDRDISALHDHYEQELISLRQRCIDYMLDRLVIDAEYGVERDRDEVVGDAMFIPLISPAKEA